MATQPATPSALGFYAAWLTEGFNQRVLSKVGEIVESLQVEPSQLTIYVTGAAALGGAVLGGGQLWRLWNGSCDVCGGCGCECK